MFLKSEHDKIRARCKYVVVDVLGSMVKVRKFGCSQFRAHTYEVRAPIFTKYQLRIGPQIKSVT